MSRFFDPKLDKLEPYVPGEQPKGLKNLIKLNTNENPFPPTPKALELMDGGFLSDLRLYPDPECTGLVGAISSFYGVSEDMIVTGNGSDELLAFLFHGFCPNGAVFPDISYGFYPVFADMFSVSYETVALREDFSVAVEDYRGKKQTVFIANPNAPTGLYLDSSEIEKLLSQDRERLVVIDEAYVDFGGESMVKLVDRYDNLIVTQTFSKSRQLAGGRLAFAIGNKELIADMNALKFSFNPYNANRAALLVGELAMRDVEYFDRCRQAIIKNREYAAGELRKMGFTLTDSRANFLFAKPPEGVTADSYYAALRENGILVRYFSEPRVCEYVRITIGTREQMERLVEVTGNILRGQMK